MALLPAGGGQVRGTLHELNGSGTDYVHIHVGIKQPQVWRCSGEFASPRDGVKPPLLLVKGIGKLSGDL
jgi:hypothetical protein